MNKINIQNEKIKCFEDTFNNLNEGLFILDKKKEIISNTSLHKTSSNIINSELIRIRLEKEKSISENEYNDKENKSPILRTIKKEFNNVHFF